MTKLFKDNESLTFNAEQWAAFLSQYPLLEAAGGVTLNPQGQLLMILKRGKWDLPKGTLEKGELLEHCALREVQEECGVSGLTLLDLKTITHHIYEEKGVTYIKRTHWYNMTCNDSTTPQPQAEEDIELAVWATPQEVKENLKNAYPSIIEVLAD